jgi:hypothetical protein
MVSELRMRYVFLSISETSRAPFSETFPERVRVCLAEGWAEESCGGAASEVLGRIIKPNVKTESERERRIFIEELLWQKRNPKALASLGEALLLGRRVGSWGGEDKRKICVECIKEIAKLLVDGERVHWNWAGKD